MRYVIKFHVCCIIQCVNGHGSIRGERPLYLHAGNKDRDLCRSEIACGVGMRTQPASIKGDIRAQEHLPIVLKRHKAKFWLIIDSSLLSDCSLFTKRFQAFSNLWCQKNYGFFLVYEMLNFNIFLFHSLNR